MKLGETLNGFTIVTPPSNTDAGMSQWCHVEKAGERFFMKMYLAPKYPTSSSPGTAAGKERRRAECERFESRHLTIAHRLQADSPGGGHLVTTLTFFRVGPCYYKVTRLVDVDRRVNLGDHDAQARSIALRSLLYSVKLMHDQGIVHGDLKPDNVLFQRTAAGAVTCKLIDFDEAYLSGQPPDVLHIIGDPIYYSPELFGYVKQTTLISPTELTVRSDIFSLAILVHVLLTGEVPHFDTDRFGYPCEAVVAGDALEFNDALPVGPLRDLLSSMLAPDPLIRPGIDDVITMFRSPELAAAMRESEVRVTGAEAALLQQAAEIFARRSPDATSAVSASAAPGPPALARMDLTPVKPVRVKRTSGTARPDAPAAEPGSPPPLRIRSTFGRTPMPAPKHVEPAGQAALPETPPTGDDQ